MSKRGFLWTVPLLLWAVFGIWYTDFGGPLTDAEIDKGLAALAQRNQGSSDRFGALERFLREDTGKQFLMVNNIDMAEAPPPMPGFEAGGSAQAYSDHYMEHMYPQLFARACHPIFFGSGFGVSVDVSGLESASDGEGWDMAALFRYKSRRALLEVITHPQMNERHAFKLAAMTKTIAYPVEPGLYVSDLRIQLFLVLGLLTALLDLLLFRRR